MPGETGMMHVDASHQKVGAYSRRQIPADPPGIGTFCMQKINDRQNKLHHYSFIINQ